MMNFNQSQLKDRAKPTNWFQPLKTASIIGLSGALACMSFFAAAADFDRAQKELKIMSKIFDTSLSEAKVNSQNRVFPSSASNNQATYLAKQGMLFTFNFGSSDFGTADDWQAFGEGVGRLVGTIASEVSEAFADIDSDLNDSVRAPRAPRAFLEADGWEEKMEAYDAYQSAMEELREDQRISRQEIRDIQRNIRDLERESKNKKQDLTTLNKSREALDVKMKELAKKQETYNKTISEYREKKNQKVRERNTKKADIILGTLCNYGATLRSLNKNEHVTLIFSNYENDRDQVYVFDYDDVTDCDSQEKLLKTAVSYQL